MRIAQISNFPAQIGIFEFFLKSREIKGSTVDKDNQCFSRFFLIVFFFIDKIQIFDFSRAFLKLIIVKFCAQFSLINFLSIFP